MNLGIWIGKESNKALIICFMIVMLVSLLYFNSLKNQFTNWDDGMIYQNPIHSESELGREFKKIFTL